MAAPTKLGAALCSQVFKMINNKLKRLTMLNRIGGNALKIFRTKSATFVFVAMLLATMVLAACGGDSEPTPSPQLNANQINQHTGLLFSLSDLSKPKPT